jgi:DNA-binding LytR/AlgR family response regulator
MKNINIVLLEDDPIDRIKIEIMIAEFTSNQYIFQLVKIFESLELLLEFLETQTVDVIISDVFTKKRATGIELLKKIKNNVSHTTPIILITQSQDLGVYQESQEYAHLQYLIKPFHKFTLQSTVENAISMNREEQEDANFNKKFIFLKGNSDSTDKVKLDEILFLETDGNYCYIHIKNKKYIIKKSLNKILQDDLDDNFIRIHHRYAVNKQHIQIVKLHSLEISGKIDFPIGKSFKKLVNTLL